jgi:hypothetical protein
MATRPAFLVRCMMSEISGVESIKERKIRLELVPETHRLSIDAFLSHFLDKFEIELNDYKSLAMQYRTGAYKNEILWKHQKISVLKMLQSYNETRRRRGKVSRAQ